MRFIIIKDYNNEDIAVNPKAISSIKELGGDICLMTNGGAISTQFRSIEAAVDYIQRASSVSMGVS